MSTSVGDLFRQASELDERDRAALAGLLLESLEREADEDVEAVWQVEVERRLAEIDANSVELVSWEEIKLKPIFSNSRLLSGEVSGKDIHPPDNLL